MKERIVLTSMARTPFSSQKGKEFQEMKLPDFSTLPVIAALERSNLGSDDVDGLILGSMTGGPGETLNLARTVALQAGLNYEKALAYTVNRICGSGFQAIASSMMEIWAEQGSVYVAAGSEMNSHRLISLPIDFSWRGMPRGGVMLGGPMFDSDPAFPASVFGKKWVSDDGKEIPYFGPGYTVEKAAIIYGVNRDDADRFAYDSQMKTKAAQESGRFENEIIPIDYPVTKGKTVEMIHCERDLHPKNETTLEVLKKLKPAFVENGVVTAGSASGQVDGAGAVVVMSESEMKRRGLKPIAYLNDFAFGGVDPTVMGTGPVPAIKKLFERTGFNFDKVDVIEINEAFCAQVLCCMKIFGFDFDSEFYKKLNPNGGATGIGHPEGATGIRLVMTVAEELKRTGKRYGVASACIGGGQGAAFLIENADA